MDVIIAALMNIILTINGDNIMNYDKTFYFKTQVIDVDNAHYLEIKAFPASSTFVVDNIREIIKNREVKVLVYMSVSNKDGKSGGVDYKVQLNKDIDRIIFGNSGKVIWENGKIQVVDIGKDFYISDTDGNTGDIRGGAKSK